MSKRNSNKNNRSISRAGIQLAIAGIVVFLGIQIAEMKFVGTYSTRANYISELGVNKSLAAYIFNSAMAIAGVLIMSSASKLRHGSFSKTFTSSLWIYGLGTFGVGVFNQNYIGSIHGTFAGLVFLSGPAVVLISRKYSHGGVRPISIVLSFISISFLFAFVLLSSSDSIGGLERLAVYPITMWLIVFGSCLIGMAGSREAPTLSN